MDADRFDAVIRGLASDASRRTAAARLLGVGLAALTAVAGRKDTDARKRRKRKRGARRRCVGETRLLCDGDCVDLATDPANCGACGNACLRDVCIHGACACEGTNDCPDGCDCAARKGGGAACRGSLTNDPCASDDDCPLGAYCLVDGRCSVACQA